MFCRVLSFPIGSAAVCNWARLRVGGGGGRRSASPNTAFCKAGQPFAGVACRISGHLEIWVHINFCGQVNETDVYIKSSLYIDLDFYDILCRLESLCFELNQGGSRFQGKGGLAKISAQEGCSYMIYIYIHQFLKAARPEPIPELTSGHVIGSKNGCQSVFFVVV